MSISRTITRAVTHFTARPSNWIGALVLAASITSFGAVPKALAPSSPDLLPLTGLQAFRQNLADAFAYLQKCGNPCVVKHDKGGSVEVAVMVAKILLDTNTPFIIDGDCISSCVIKADLARRVTCVTPKATFSDHMWKRYDYVEDPIRNVRILTGTSWVDPQHSPDIDAIFKNLGGYPKLGLVIMENVKAQQVWPLCNTGSRIAQR